MWFSSVPRNSWTKQRRCPQIKYLRTTPALFLHYHLIDNPVAFLTTVPWSFYSHDEVNTLFERTKQIRPKPELSQAVECKRKHKLNGNIAKLPNAAELRLTWRVSQNRPHRLTLASLPLPTATDRNCSSWSTKPATSPFAFLGHGWTTPLHHSRWPPRSENSTVTIALTIFLREVSLRH